MPTDIDFFILTWATKCHKRGVLSLTDLFLLQQNTYPVVLSRLSLFDAKWTSSSVRSRSGNVGLDVRETDAGMDTPIVHLSKNGGVYMRFVLVMVLQRCYGPVGFVAFIHHEGRHTIKKVEIHKKHTMKHKNIQ